MDKRYDHNKYEATIYEMWEKSGAFKPKKSGKPYTILMPPPNANDALHAGHTMYSIEDILIRWKRMQGFATQWLPGTDHAGFETQYVYEKELAKKGKSRLDYDSKTLYKNIFKFVQDNSGLIFDQFKRLGFSAYWERSVFTLDKHVIDRVYKTFKKMESENLVYRDDYIVNYCPHCGTSLAELEVNHIEREDPLYYIKYPFIDSENHLIVATVRPETMFGDTAVTVNPKDKRYKKLVGEKVKLPLTNRSIPIIEDRMVDMEFGTGAVKITPAHDPNDYKVGKDNKLEVISVIGLDGKMKLPKDVITENIEGKNVDEARKLTVEELDNQDLIQKIDKNYIHAVTVCYRCKNDLEPTTIPNWFIKVEDLKKPIIKAVKNEDVKFIPGRYKKHMLQWLDIMHDWPISRQIVWGIRIPAWYDVKNNPKLQVTFMPSDKKAKSITGSVSELLKDKHNFEEIEAGLQSLIAPPNAKYTISKTKPGDSYLQETDTFDTWFSSGHWPLVTLKKNEYNTHLPTDVMGTLYDILKFWVSRMILFSLYLEDKVPFKDVYLWSMVVDEKGVKMSKSKGNVINPIDLVDKYGADALRMSLVYGIPSGSKVILSDDKVRGMRNFANKIWNVARFVTFNNEDLNKSPAKPSHKDDKWILKELDNTTSKMNKALDEYKLNEASEEIYEFIWHKFADVYIEKTKTRRNDAQSTLELVLQQSLKLLHPFMPFVTEAIWKENTTLFDSSLLITSNWPISKT